MDVPPKFRGGLQIGESLLGSQSVPFASLTVYDDHVRVHTLFTGPWAERTDYDIPLEAIDAVERSGSWLTHRLRIRHHATAPAYIVFRSRKTDSISALLASKSVKLV